VRIKQGIAPAIVSIGIGIVALPHIAEAHTAEVSASCTEGLRVNVFQYTSPTTTVTIDDTQVAVETGNGSHTYSLGSPSVAHSYLVVIDEVGTEFDKRIPGTVPACVAAPSTTAPTTTQPPAQSPTTAAATTTTAPAADAPATTTTAPGATTTTAPGATTTTASGVVGGRTRTLPPPTSSATAAASSGALPATGSTSGAIAGIGAALLAAGGALCFVGRRTRRLPG
jgi:LPXTG-motif cell wall-anchored protein